MPKTQRQFHVALREADRHAAVVVDAVDADAAIRAARKLIPWAGSIISVAVRCSGRTVTRAHRLGTLSDRPCQRWTRNGYCCESHKPKEG